MAPVDVVSATDVLSKYLPIVLPIIAVMIHKLFLYYPAILHGSKKQGRMGLAEVVAHRGSRLEGLPENTVAAFKDACDARADVIEFDVWLTLDGQVQQQWRIIHRCIHGF